MILLLSILLAIPFIIWALKIPSPILTPEIKGEKNLTMEEQLKKLEEEFVEECKYMEDVEGQEVMKVEMVNSSFDISKIKEYKGEAIKKFEFRPQTFEQFVGQPEAKEKAQIIIEGIKKNIFLHFLIDGIKGHGKTAFIELIAKSLNAKLIERVGKQVDEKNLPDIIQKEINESKEKYVMFFIDEIDTMDWKVLKILNPIIESYKIAGKKIKPFIFVGATINKHILLDRNPDTLDRIHEKIKFKRYNSKEIAQILILNKNQLFSEYTVPEDIIKIISQNCKFNPRTSISLLKEYIITENINKVLKSSDIVKNGLTKNDIRILKILDQSKRAIGANALAMKAGLSEREYTREYEPFLVEYDYVNRIPSRVIGEEGKNFLEEIKCI